MKIALLTLGCKVNQAETSTIETGLRNNGHEIVDLNSSPDVCIINTCTVTSKSDCQSRQLIRRAHKLGARVIVTGCYSELNYESVSTMEGVEKVFKNSNKFNIINKFADKHENIVLNPFISGRTRFFVKVQDGCDNACSYCSIPLARGASSSIHPDVVIRQVSKAVDSGFTEIVLTGIHLGLYGRDLKLNMNLSSLLKAIFEKTSITRLRLSSIEINEIDDELLELISDTRVCNHLHIPLQSGDNYILNLMNRSYTVGEFEKKIIQIHRQIPGISIGTDVIVGFPGEGEKEFANTCNLLESLPFAYLHVFPFSSRPNTLAANMDNIVSSSVKKERVNIMHQISKQKKCMYMKQSIGQILEVIVEEKTDDGIFSGTSRNYLKVRLSGYDIPRGSLVFVRVEGMQNNALCGTAIF